MPSTRVHAFAPVTYIGVWALLLVIALQASRVDPMKALRVKRLREQ